jgi:hypothetical protein
MNDVKRERIAKAQLEANERRRRAIRSLAHCLGRSDVMRLHHDGLVNELVEAGDVGQFTTIKKQRFIAYVCFWFAGLATVVERYQQLVSNGTMPDSEKVSKLLTTEFIDVLKPFRNAVAHCSDYDDARVLQLLDNPHTIPDHAAAVSLAFREYCGKQDPSVYEVTSSS